MEEKKGQKLLVNNLSGKDPNFQQRSRQYRVSFQDKHHKAYHRLQDDSRVIRPAHTSDVEQNKRRHNK